ncbi:MDIS1-interacting receptor like kinase 1-like [Musa acuminata AAA Group]|uniref:MDIS1-interacting receptor like kinase 1-like n=1 Tax=Musa acuminata AAA Group TaxID=214697 RepID=UPI0031E305C5
MFTRLAFIFFLAFFCAVIAYAAPADEVAALLSIKAELDDPLNALGDWNLPTDVAGSSHCNWTGVRCSSTGAVDGLDLSHLNLSGLIAGDIRRLTSLVRLNLCSNSFSSSLPEAIADLTMLRELDVSDNNFVRHFPTGLGGFQGLTSLNASGNNFDGPIPDDIGNATALETLDLRGNFFAGSIPLSYRNLQRLKFLGLSGNNLRGRLPAELGQLSSLETLIIGYNEIEGPIPAELGNLTNLRYLDMAVGNLSGAIPAKLGRLQSLTTVYLYKNNLDGEIPREIGDISSLQMLDLSDNLISGSIPPELSRLSNLKLLNLMCNRLKGAVPAGIGELPQLEVLELWNNSLSGALPANLGLNSPLQFLDVSSNSLSGKIPAGVCDGGNLTKLILFNNAFSGPIPTGLSTCLSLVRVRMQNNRLNGTIPSGLGRLPKLQRLELAGNELSGEIPDDISSSTSLSFIDLSHNHLRSSLPSNILSMPTLQTFLAADNELTGGIPDELQDCPSLSALDLSTNRLSGCIPSSLASCQHLVSLSLRSNRLTGTIPSSLATMPTLSILDLSNNFLTGTIPDNFGGSPALEMLNLAYNNLSGPVPANGLLLTINPDDLAGNAGLCGGGALPPCAANSPWASTTSPKASHLKHIAAGWLIGISAVLMIGLGVLGARRLYQMWHIDGGCCGDGKFEEETGAWPWRLTAFQRLNFTSTDVLACVKEANIIGMGATGIVYKAELHRHHAAVAVKKLWRPEGAAAELGDSDAGDLVTEVSLLGRLRHRNIVKMLGYVRNGAEMMILYEYMQNGSLWEALHGKQEGRLLVDWVSRYNVAAGIAHGLAYLHHDCHPQVIHRDVKSSNVLLDGNLEAKIADFGLARMMVRKNETVSVVAGSYGYIAPEYGYTLKVDEKTDIYSFGVVLMELLTGKRPVEMEFGESQDIVGWVRGRLRSNHGVEELLDSSIGGRCEHVREEMLLVLRVAVLCTARSPKDRPPMRDVLTMLAEAKPRRKSSSSGGGGVVAKDKPVFTTSPDSGYP